MSAFSVAGDPVPDSTPCQNIFAFCAFMAAAVAERRGGQPSAYISECAHFMVDVVGRRLSVSDPLPPDFDWTVAAARESAEAMMEYDDA